MSVKRALRLEDKENTPAKRHAPDRNYSPMTGTRPMSPAISRGNCKASGTTVKPPKAQEPLTDAEKLHDLRAKLEGSMRAIMKAKHQLEKVVPIDGSSELMNLFLRSGADLRTELQRNKELAAKVESCISGTGSGQGHYHGVTQTGSSCDFLKAILS